MTSIVTDTTNNGNQYGDQIEELLFNLKSRVSDNDWIQINNYLLSFSLSDEKQICFLLWIELFLDKNQRIDWRFSFDTASHGWSPDGLQEVVDQSRDDEKSVNFQMACDLFRKKSKLTQEQQDLRDKFIALQEQWLDSEVPNLEFESSTANDEAIARAIQEELNALPVDGGQKKSTASNFESVESESDGENDRPVDGRQTKYTASDFESVPSESESESDRENDRPVDGRQTKYTASDFESVSDGTDSESDGENDLPVDGGIPKLNQENKTAILKSKISRIITPSEQTLILKRLELLISFFKKHYNDVTDTGSGPIIALFKEVAHSCHYGLFEKCIQIISNSKLPICDSASQLLFKLRRIEKDGKDSINTISLQSGEIYEDDKHTFKQIRSLLYGLGDAGFKNGCPDLLKSIIEIHNHLCRNNNSFEKRFGLYTISNKTLFDYISNEFTDTNQYLSESKIEYIPTFETFTKLHHHILELMLDLVWFSIDEKFSTKQELVEILNYKIKQVRDILKFNYSLENTTYKSTKDLLSNIASNATLNLSCFKIPVETKSDANSLLDENASDENASEVDTSHTFDDIVTIGGLEAFEEEEKEEEKDDRLKQNKQKVLKLQKEKHDFGRRRKSSKSRHTSIVSKIQKVLLSTIFEKDHTEGGYRFVKIPERDQGDIIEAILLLDENKTIRESINKFKTLLDFKKHGNFKNNDVIFIKEIYNFAVKISGNLKKQKKTDKPLSEKAVKAAKKAKAKEMKRAAAKAAQNDYSNGFESLDDEVSGDERHSNVDLDQPQEKQEVKTVVSSTNDIPVSPIVSIDIQNNIMNYFDKNSKCSLLKLFDIFETNNFNFEICSNIMKTDSETCKYISYILYNTDKSRAHICNATSNFKECNKLSLLFIIDKLEFIVPTFTKIKDDILKVVNKHFQTTKSDRNVSEMALKYKFNKQKKSNYFEDLTLDDYSSLSEGLYAKIQIYVINSIIEKKTELTYEIKGIFLQAIRNFDNFVIDINFAIATREALEDIEGREKVEDRENLYGYNMLTNFDTYITTIKRRQSKLLKVNPIQFMGEKQTLKNDLFSWQKKVLLIITGTNAYGQSNSNIRSLILNLPTGVGKTWLMYYIILQYHRKLSIVYTAPQNVLEQICVKLAHEVCILFLENKYSLNKLTRVGPLALMLGSVPRGKSNKCGTSKKAWNAGGGSGDSKELKQSIRKLKGSYTSGHYPGCREPDVILSTSSVEPPRLECITVKNKVFVLDDHFTWQNVDGEFVFTGDNILKKNGEQLTPSQFNKVIHNITEFDNLRNILNRCTPKNDNDLLGECKKKKKERDGGILVLISATIPKLVKTFINKMVGKKLVSDCSNSVHQTPQEIFYLTENNKLEFIPLKCIISGQLDIDVSFQRVLLSPQRKATIIKICKTLFNEDNLEDVNWNSFIVDKYDDIIRCINDYQQKEFDDKSQYISSLSGLKYGFSLVEMNPTSVIVQGNDTLETSPEILEFIFSHFIDLTDLNKTPENAKTKPRLLNNYMDSIPVHSGSTKTQESDKTHASDKTQESDKTLVPWDPYVVPNENHTFEVTEKAKVKRFDNGYQRRKIKHKKFKKEFDVMSAKQVRDFKNTFSDRTLSELNLYDLREIAKYIRIAINHADHPYYKQLSKLRLNVSDIQFVALARRINPFIEQSGIDSLFQDLIVKNKEWRKGFIVYVNSNQDVKGHDSSILYEWNIICSDRFVSKDSHIELSNDNTKKAYGIQAIGRNGRGNQIDAKVIISPSIIKWIYTFTTNICSFQNMYDLYMDRIPELDQIHPILKWLQKKNNFADRSYLKVSGDLFKLPISLQSKGISKSKWMSSKLQKSLSNLGLKACSTRLVFSKLLFHKNQKVNHNAICALIALNEENSKNLFIKNIDTNIQNYSLHTILSSIQNYIKYFVKNISKFKESHLISDDLYSKVTCLKDEVEGFSNQRTIVLITSYVFFKAFGNEYLENLRKHMQVIDSVKMSPAFKLADENRKSSLLTDKIDHNEYMESLNFHSLNTYFNEQNEWWAHKRWQDMNEYYIQVLFTLDDGKNYETFKKIICKSKEFWSTTSTNYADSLRELRRDTHEPQKSSDDYSGEVSGEEIVLEYKYNPLAGLED
jgi:hypothetical protein